MIKINCKQCKKAFEVKPSAIKNGKKYCSRICYSIAIKEKCGIELKCLNCGKIFRRTQGVIAQNRGKYCCRECYNKSKFVSNLVGKYHSSHLNGRKLPLHVKIWIKANGPVPKNCVIHHIDRNRFNNDISNLQMMTASEHSSYHNKGEKNHFAKLTKKDIIEIKNSFKNNNYHGKNKDLANKYNVSPRTISSIKTNQSWKHIKL